MTAFDLFAQCNIGWCRHSKGRSVRKKLISLILVGLGVLVLLGGILASTAFKPDSQVSLSTQKTDDSGYIRVPAEVLSLLNPNVEITATAPNNGEVALILGRTSDIAGWIGSEPSYIATGAQDWNHLGLMEAPVDTGDAATSDENGTSLGELASENDPEAETEDAQAEDSKENSAPTLASTNSDMWISHIGGSGQQKMALKSVEPGLTLLVASVDPSNGAPIVTATWEREVATPLLVPALVLGILLAAAGIALAWVPSKKPAPKSAQSLTARSGEAETNLSVASPIGVGAETPKWMQSQETKQDTDDIVASSSSSETKRSSFASKFARKSDSDRASSRGNSIYSSPTASAVSESGAVAPVKNAAPHSYFDPAQRVTASVESAPSVASAATIARAVVEEPNLNTAELRQLGLTRRQLREMRESANSASPTSAASASPTGPNPSASATTPEQNTFGVQPVPAASHNSTGALAAVEESTSKTSGSSWRAAWGVRAGTDVNTDGSQATGLGEALSNFAPTEQTSSAVPPNDTSSQLNHPYSGQATTPEQVASPNTHDDSRQPASWWGSESAASPNAGTRRARHGDSYGSSESSLSAVSPAERETEKTTDKRPAPATRRALYSSYRAEAERLSAEADWPVPAPADDHANNDKEGK